MQDILKALEHDLAQNGVTAALSEDAVSWFEAVKPQAEPAPAISNEKTASAKTTEAPKAPESEAKPKIVAPTQQPPVRRAGLEVEFIWVKPQAQVNLLLSVFDKRTQELTGAEQELLDNMMKAAGVAEYGIAIAAGAGAHASVQSANLPEHVLIMGEGAAQAFTGKLDSLMNLRDTHAGQITFHPKTLLAQPMLKKLAWEDLKQWQSKRGQN